MTSTPYRKSTQTVHDQYYMQPHVAQYVAEQIHAAIKNHNIAVTRFEDPCAGSGELTQFFPGADAYDLDPKPSLYGIEIKQRDFLRCWSIKRDRSLMFIMNVPYGYQSKAAIAFFNHAALFAGSIAITVPKTWEKGTYDNKLSRDFHCVESFPLPKDSFYLPSKNNKPHDVPSIVQIWVRRSELRPKKVERRTSKYFFLRSNRGMAYSLTPDLAIRRVGANAGELSFDWQFTAGGWWYLFIKDQHRSSVIEAAQQINWYQLGNGMGQRSLKASELIEAIEQQMVQHSTY